MITVYKEVEVEVELDDVDDDSLIDEVVRRNLLGSFPGTGAELITEIWQKRRVSQKFDSELDALIYQVIGKVV